MPVGMPVDTMATTFGTEFKHRFCLTLDLFDFNLDSRPLLYSICKVDM